jgi:hypothetical protein
VLIEKGETLAGAMVFGETGAKDWSQLPSALIQIKRPGPGSGLLDLTFMLQAPGPASQAYSVVRSSSVLGFGTRCPIVTRLTFTGPVCPSARMGSSSK